LEATPAITQNGKSGRLLFCDGNATVSSCALHKKKGKVEYINGSCDVKREERERITAGEVFCGRARIPEPIVVPIIRATAPARVPLFWAELGGSSLKFA